MVVPRFMKCEETRKGGEEGMKQWTDQGNEDGRKGGKEERRKGGKGERRREKERGNRSYRMMPDPGGSASPAPSAQHQS